MIGRTLPGPRAEKAQAKVLKRLEGYCASRRWIVAAWRAHPGPYFTSHWRLQVWIRDRLGAEAETTITLEPDRPEIVNHGGVEYADLTAADFEEALPGLHIPAPVSRRQLDLFPLAA